MIHSVSQPIAVACNSCLFENIIVEHFTLLKFFLAGLGPQISACVRAGSCMCRAHATALSAGVGTVLIPHFWGVGYQWSQPRPPLPTGHSSSPPHTYAQARGVCMCAFCQEVHRGRFSTARHRQCPVACRLMHQTRLCFARLTPKRLLGSWGLSRASEAAGDIRGGQGSSSLRT